MVLRRTNPVKDGFIQVTKQEQLPQRSLMDGFGLVPKFLNQQYQKQKM